MVGGPSDPCPRDRGHGRRAPAGRAPLARARHPDRERGGGVPQRGREPVRRPRDPSRRRRRNRPHRAGARPRRDGGGVWGLRRRRRDGNGVDGEGPHQIWPERGPLHPPPGARGTRSQRCSRRLPRRPGRPAHRDRGLRRERRRRHRPRAHAGDRHRGNRPPLGERRPPGGDRGNQPPRGALRLWVRPPDRGRHDAQAVAGAARTEVGAPMVGRSHGACGDRHHHGHGAVARREPVHRPAGAGAPQPDIVERAARPHAGGPRRPGARQRRERRLRHRSAPERSRQARPRGCRVRPARDGGPARSQRSVCASWTR